MIHLKEETQVDSRVEFSKQLLEELQQLRYGQEKIHFKLRLA